MVKFVPPLRVPRRGASRTSRVTTGASRCTRSASSSAGSPRTPRTGSCSSSSRGWGSTSTRCPEPADARREPDQRLRLGRRRAERLPPERAHRRPEPPRDHAARPALALTPIYLRSRSPWLGALLAFLLVVELATLSRSGLVGLVVGFSCCSCTTAASCSRARSSSRSPSWPRSSRGRRAPRRLLPRGDPLARRDRATRRPRRTSTSTGSSPTCSRRTRSSGSG